MSIAVLALLVAAQAPPEKPVGAPPPSVAPPPIVAAPPAPPKPPRILPPSAPRVSATRGAVTPAIVAGPQPRAALQSLISAADYPASALARREQGRPRFRLTVGADGRVTGCIILVSTGSSALDSATCRLMRSRARFTPARDASGNPAEDQYFGEIAWRL